MHGDVEAPQPTAPAPAVVIACLGLHWANDLPVSACDCHSVKAQCCPLSLSLPRICPWLMHAGCLSTNWAHVPAAACACSQAAHAKYAGVVQPCRRT